MKTAIGEIVLLALLAIGVHCRSDYNPCRVVVEGTDVTIPVAGLPITIGRRYDSLEKDKIGSATADRWSSATRASRSTPTSASR